MTLGATTFQNFLCKYQIYVNSQLIIDEKEKLVALHNEVFPSDAVRHNMIANDIKSNDSEVSTVQHMLKYFNSGSNFKFYKVQMVLDTFSEQSGSVGKYMMGLFYSTIGLGFRFDKIKAVQGPLGILLAVTLACHIFTIVIGSILWNSCVLFLARLGNWSQGSGLSYNESNSDKSNNRNIAFAFSFDDVNSVDGNFKTDVSINCNTNNDDKSHRNIDRKCSDNSESASVIDPNVALDYLIDMDTALVAR